MEFIPWFLRSREDILLAWLAWFGIREIQRLPCARLYDTLLFIHIKIRA